MLSPPPHLIRTRLLQILEMVLEPQPNPVGGHARQLDRLEHSLSPLELGRREILDGNSGGHSGDALSLYLSQHAGAVCTRCSRTVSLGCEPSLACYENSKKPVRSPPGFPLVIVILLVIVIAPSARLTVRL